MTRIIDYGGRDAERTATVASVRALKGSGTQLAQVTTATEDEAAAAEEAGIEMIICMAQVVPEVRRGSRRCFLTAAIDFGGEVTPDDLLRTALTALDNGADAVISARRLEAIELIAAEDIPVMGHLGFVPKKSSLYGGIRSVGKTAEEALGLWRQFRDLENAGAFAVECELIPSNVLSEINSRTSLATISLGSGPHADVLFLFMSDICGESARRPRHARQYADLAALQQQIRDTRVDALSRFRSDVRAGGFPDETEVNLAADEQLTRFLEMLDADAT